MMRLLSALVFLSLIGSLQVSSQSATNGTTPATTSNSTVAATSTQPTAGLSESVSSPATSPDQTTASAPAVITTNTSLTSNTNVSTTNITTTAAISTNTPIATVTSSLTSAMPSSSTSPETARTHGFESTLPANITEATTASAPVTTAQPSSSSLVSGTTVPPTATKAPNVNTATVSADSAVTTTTTTTTTSSTPTTTVPVTPAPSQYEIKKPVKPFQLNFTIGSSSDSAVYCVNVSCTFSSIVGDLDKAFRTIPGYLYLKEAHVMGNRRKRDVQLTVLVMFDTEKLSSLPHDRTKYIETALTLLNNSPLFKVDMVKANVSIVKNFETVDVCQIPGACDTGYQCRSNLCYHICDQHSVCGDHGECQAVLSKDGSARTTCLCRADAEQIYSGDTCQNTEMSKAKVASILGGVLGTICAVLFITIILLCYRMRTDGDGSRQKYQLGGHSNNGFAEQDFDMRERS